MIRCTTAAAMLVAIAFGTACEDDGSGAPNGPGVSTVPTSEPSQAGATTTTGAPTMSATTPATRPATVSTTPPTTTTTVAASSSVMRPYVADPDVCDATAARETNTRQFADGLLRPFALSSAGWHRFQIVADPDVGFDGGWALVGTIPGDRFDADLWSAGAASEYHRYDTINGWPVAITATPSGYADASIDLGEEIDAYVRATGFDHDSIRALISALTVRVGPDPIGFDYAPTGELPGLDIVIDRGDEPVDADIAVLDCTAEDGAIIRIAAITGDPLAQYVLILDQPYPSEVGRIGDAVVSIGDLGDLGRALDEGRPHLSDVTDAPDDVWADLLERRPSSEGPAPSDP